MVSTVTILASILSVNGGVTLEMPKDLETSKKYSHGLANLKALPSGGLLAFFEGGGSLVLTNNLETNPNFNPGLLAFPADSYPSGGVVCKSAQSNAVLRLDASGAPVTSFVSIGFTANDVIQVIAAQPDGKVLVGGSFNGVPGGANSFL